MNYLCNWNSFVTLPFKAGCENITTACKQKQLLVIKRTFRDRTYKYESLLNTAPFSLQTRAALFTRGVVLCLPIVGHIVSLALRCFSSCIFPEMPFDLEIKCSPSQKLEITKLTYANKFKNSSNFDRIALANTLISRGNIQPIIDNICYINLFEDLSLTKQLFEQCTHPELIKSRLVTQILNNPNDSDFIVNSLNFLELAPITLQEIIKELVLQINRSVILQQNPSATEIIGILLASHIFSTDSTSNLFIVQLIDSFQLNLAMSQELIKKLVLRTKNTPTSSFKLAAIASAALKCNVTDQLFRDSTLNIALAKILLKQEENVACILDNISHINLLEDLSFTQTLFQDISSPKQFIQLLAKQILEKESIDKGFITSLFENINLRAITQEEVIQAILYQMNSTTSYSTQIAVAYAIVKKYRRGPVVLIEHIDRFTHTKELHDLLLETIQGRNYVKVNINKFKPSEQKKQTLQYATNA